MYKASNPICVSSVLSESNAKKQKRSECIGCETRACAFLRLIVCPINTLVASYILRQGRNSSSRRWTQRTQNTGLRILGRIIVRIVGYGTGQRCNVGATTCSAATASAADVVVVVGVVVIIGWPRGNGNGSDSSCSGYVCWLLRCCRSLSQVWADG